MRNVPDRCTEYCCCTFKMAAGFWRFSFGIFLFSIALGFSSSASDGKVIELTEDNWKQILEGEWMIKL